MYVISLRYHIHSICQEENKTFFTFIVTQGPGCVIINRSIFKRGRFVSEKKFSIKKIPWKILACFIILLVVVEAVIAYVDLKNVGEMSNDMREKIQATYGENRKIEGSDYDSSLAVACHNGTYVGKKENGVRSYRGIPYAKPPVGELRWKAPVLAEADDGVYEAYYYGKSPIQTEAETEQASAYPQGEDCLTLNVWTNDNGPSEGKPVMVFFPGGAYGWGGTADPIYDGQNFSEAQKDVVLVTVNYRVGLMGFMDFSTVEGGESFRESGNLGLLDHICALQWVQQNIRGFGGDPNNVTIFGESAGGCSVSLLPIMEQAKGLFHRVIAQSGSVAFTFSKEEDLALTEMFLEKTGAKTMDDLMALTEEELMKANETLNDYNNFPERDGYILPEDVYAPYDKGVTAGIDMMSGTNEDEARYFIGEIGGIRIYKIAAPLMFESMVSRLSREDRKYAKAFMDLQTEDEVWNATEFMNELVFRVPAIYQSVAHSRNGGKAYMYYWTKKSTIPDYGACHAVELAYVFGNLNDTIYTGDPADPELSALVQEMWVNFAKTGNPGTEEHRWDPYDEYTRKTMVLGEEVEMVEDPLPLQRMLIEPLLQYRFNGYYKTADYTIKTLRRDLLRGFISVTVAGMIIFGIFQSGEIFRWFRTRKKKR